MPSDRQIIDGVEHILLHNPSEPGSQIVIPVEPSDGDEPIPAVSGQE